MSRQPSVTELAAQWQKARRDAQSTGCQRLAAQAEQLRQQLHDHPSTDAARTRTDRADQARRTRGGETRGFR